MTAAVVNDLIQNTNKAEKSACVLLVEHYPGIHTLGYEDSWGSKHTGRHESGLFWSRT